MVEIAVMKQPHFSLLLLLGAFSLASIFMACSKIIGVNATSVGLIAICSVVVLGFAVRIFFFDR